MIMIRRLIAGGCLFATNPKEMGLMKITNGKKNKKRDDQSDDDN